MNGQGNNVKNAEGMTLLEAAIAMSIMAVVMAAVLPILAGVRNTWDAGQSGTESVQNERVLADHLYRHLAAAKAITDVSVSTEPAGHIQFAASDGSTYRYEIGSDHYVQFGPVGNLADLAGPVSQLQFTCYAVDDFTTPSTDVASIRLVQAQATFPKTKLAGQDKTVTAKAYLRVGSAPGGGVDPAFKTAIAAKSKVNWGGAQTQIDSYHSSKGAYDPFNPGHEAVLSVNVTSSNKIILSGGTKLYGDAYAGPGGNPRKVIEVIEGSLITGKQDALTAVVDIPAISNPGGVPFSGSPENGIKLSGWTSQTINSNRYFKQLLLYDHSNIVISGNVTILVQNKMELDDSSVIEIQPGASARIYIKGTLSVWNSARLNESTKDPSKLRLYVTGNNKTTNIGDSTVVYAVLQNPKAKVAISDGAQFFGKIKAESLEGGGKIHVDLDCDFD